MSHHIFAPGPVTALIETTDATPTLGYEIELSGHATFHFTLEVVAHDHTVAGSKTWNVFVTATKHDTTPMFLSGGDCGVMGMIATGTGDTSMLGVTAWAEGNFMRVRVVGNPDRSIFWAVKVIPLGVYFVPEPTAVSGHPSTPPAEPMFDLNWRRTAVLSSYKD